MSGLLQMLSQPRPQPQPQGTPPLVSPQQQHLNALRALYQRYGAATPPPTGPVPGRMAAIQPPQLQKPPLSAPPGGLNPSSIRVDFHAPEPPETPQPSLQ